MDFPSYHPESYYNDEGINFEQCKIKWKFVTGSKDES